MMAKLSNIVYVVHRALQHLSVKHTTLGLKEKLEGHPDFPSLMSVSDLLTEWNVANEAFRLDKNVAVPNELGSSFIAQLKVEGGRLI